MSLTIDQNVTQTNENEKCKDCPHAEQVIEDNRYTDAFGWAGTVDIWYRCTLERCEDELS